MYKTLVLITVIYSIQALAKDITYKVGDTAYESYAILDSKESPTVFILHDWDGLTNYEKKRAQMLVEFGYSVFAIDLFGKGIRPTKNKDKKQHTGQLYKDRKKMRTLLDAAFKRARALGMNTERAVAIGYCFGGAAVLEWARSGAPLRTFASFHGGLGTPKKQNYKKTQGKILVYHGSADDHISLKDFAKLGTQLEKEGVAHEMITYSGAPHAFTVFGAKSYREDADKKSWEHFLNHINSTLRK